MISRRRKRWSRFSIRFLFVCLFFSAVGLGWWHRAIHAPKLALEQLLSSSVLDDLSIANWDPSTSSTLFRWVAVQSGLTYDPRSVTEIRSTTLTELGVLKHFPNLEVLFLNEYVPESQLVNIQGLSCLSLADTDFADCRLLESFQQLRSLDLARTQVQDVSALAKLKSLRGLNLAGLKLKESELQDLREALPMCELVFDTKTFQEFFPAIGGAF